MKDNSIGLMFAGLFLALSIIGFGILLKQGIMRSAAINNSMTAQEYLEFHQYIEDNYYKK